MAIDRKGYPCELLMAPIMFKNKGHPWVMMSPELCNKWRTQSTCFCLTSGNVVVDSSFNGDINNVCNLCCEEIKIHQLESIHSFWTNIFRCLNSLNLNLKTSLNTWFSFKGVVCWNWIAERTIAVMASIPHSLMRITGWWHTSSKWFVTGRHNTSTRFILTNPVSKSLATAKREGSYKKIKGGNNWGLILSLLKRM